MDVITVGDGVQSFADASGNNQSLVEVMIFLFSEFIYWIEYQFYFGGFCKNLFQACIQRIPLSSNNISGLGTLIIFVDYLSTITDILHTLVRISGACYAFILILLCLC